MSRFGVLLVQSAFSGAHLEFTDARPTAVPAHVVVTARAVTATCSTCLESITAGQSMTLLHGCLANGALHAFHAPCLEPWISKGNGCPVCRAS